MADQSSGLDWQDGTPISRRFDDPYFSLNDGLAETRHVFLDGNDLPERFARGFHIAELGFGTGLNLVAALQLWRGSDVTGPLRFTSFEAFPLEAAEMRRALEMFDGAEDDLSDLLEALEDGARVVETEDLRFEMIEGDARETMPRWAGRADAWFLDGFSPAKNPEMWDAQLMQAVAEHTAPGGTFATYTAAGYVRRALCGAGFDVTRAPGYGRKRHMSKGRLRGGDD